MAALLEEGLAIAFPIILRDIALNFYYTAIKGYGFTINVMINKFKQRFEIEERVRLLINEWNLASIQTIIAKNTDKTMIDCLNILVKDLTSL